MKICHPTKDKPELKIQQSPLDNENVSQNREDYLPSTGFDNILLVGGMTRMPKVYKFLIFLFVGCLIVICGQVNQEGTLIEGAFEGLIIGWGGYLEKQFLELFWIIFKSFNYLNRLEILLRRSLKRKYLIPNMKKEHLQLELFIWVYYLGI